MADGVRREAWDHTAHLLSKLSNGFDMTLNGEPFHPRDCTPYPDEYDQGPTEGPLPNPQGIDVLKCLLSPVSKSR